MKDVIRKRKEQLTAQGRKVSCPIWKGTEAWVEESFETGDELYHSPRAGGVFRSEHIEDHDFFPRNEEIRIKVSRWVYDKNRLGEIGYLTYEEVRKIERQERLQIEQRMDRLLRCFAELPSQVSLGLCYAGRKDKNLTEFQIIEAATECWSEASEIQVSEASYRIFSGTMQLPQELSWLISAAVESGWLEKDAPSSESRLRDSYIRLTPAGVKRLEELETRTVDSDQESVVMPFDVSVDRAHEEDINSGVEVEEDDETKIEHPFDPEKIKVRTTSILVGQLVSRIEHEEIDLEPDFQRLSVWDSKRRCRFIESLLLKIPIPVFYVVADEQENWSVVDGIQRISTVYDYVTDKFPLSQLEYLSQLDGMKHSELSRRMQRRIDETEFVVNVIEPGTSEDVMFNIFRRINTGGMPLRGQEIRNALYPGPVREYLKELAETKEFLKATDKFDQKKPVWLTASVSCVLSPSTPRPWEEYDANDLNGYLCRAMEHINAMTLERRNSISKDFKKAMQAAYDLFGQDAFRKRKSQDDSRRPVSKALFEAWSVQLARCSPEQIRELVTKREKVIDRFLTLMNQDGDFDKAISYSTGVPRRVKKRFSAIEQLVKEVV